MVEQISFLVTVNLKLLFINYTVLITCYSKECTIVQIYTMDI
jgi:hypothetical protein